MTKALFKKGINSIIITTNEGLISEHNIELNIWKSSDYGDVIYQDTMIHMLPLKALYRTAKELKNANVIHLTSIFYPLSWLTAIINRCYYKKPVVWSPRGELDGPALIYSSYKKKPVIFIIRAFLADKVTFHATCKEEVESIKSIFGNHTKTCLIQNYLPVQSDVFELKKSDHILYLGRIHPKKAIENLVEGFEMATKNISENFNLVIAGNFENAYGLMLQKMVIEKKLQKRILFVGHVEGDSKMKLLKYAKCLILPSHSENFGNVVIEALEYGTPVIASKGTPWEILNEKNAGIWSKNDGLSLSKAMTTIINMNENSYEEICRNANKLVKDHFDVDSNIENWIDLYKSLN